MTNGNLMKLHLNERFLHFAVVQIFVSDVTKVWSFLGASVDAVNILISMVLQQMIKNLSSFWEVGLVNLKCKYCTIKKLNHLHEQFDTLKEKII